LPIKYFPKRINRKKIICLYRKIFVLNGKYLSYMEIFFFLTYTFPWKLKFWLPESFGPNWRTSYSEFWNHIQFFLFIWALDSKGQLMKPYKDWLRMEKNKFCSANLFVEQSSIFRMTKITVPRLLSTFYTNSEHEHENESFVQQFLS
jgi:hypothetical protein